MKLQQMNQKMGFATYSLLMLNIVWSSKIGLNNLRPLQKAEAGMLRTL